MHVASLGTMASLPRSYMARQILPTKSGQGNGLPDGLGPVRSHHVWHLARQYLSWWNTRSYTAGHERRVGLIASAIAKEMGLDGKTLRADGRNWNGAMTWARFPFLLKFWAKPTGLTHLEMEMMKGHAQAGYEFSRMFLSIFQLQKSLVSIMNAWINGLS